MIYGENISFIQDEIVMIECFVLYQTKIDPLVYIDCYDIATMIRIYYDLNFFLCFILYQNFYCIILMSFDEQNWLLSSDKT